jgi:anti-anti-sigma regulatory factor
MGVKLNQADEASRVELVGVVDIASAQELKSALVDAIAQKKKVTVFADADAELDVTAAQLLWAAEREANEKYVEFAYAGNPPEAIEDLFRKVGLPPPVALK